MRPQRLQALAAGPGTAPATLDRRSFLKLAGLAGGGFALGTAPARGNASAGTQAKAAPSAPQAFVSIAPDNTVTVAVNRLEFGQGVHTGLPMALAEELDAELVAMGSAGVKVISVARDLTDAYVHAGGQYEWDSAAPVAVARAAGLFTSRIDGRPLEYNQDDVYLPDLVVCRPELAEPILAHLAEHGVA